MQRRLRAAAMLSQLRRRARLTPAPGSRACSATWAGTTRASFRRALPCVSGLAARRPAPPTSGASISPTEAPDPLPPPTKLLDGGAFYGGPSGQWPLAIGWWAIGHFSHSPAGADAG